MRVRELNIQACSRDVQFGDEIQELVNNTVDKQATNAGDGRGQSEAYEGPSLENKQAAEYEAGTLMKQVASRRMLRQLPVRFYEYMKIKGRVLAAPVDPKQVAQFLTHYYHGLFIPVQEFQGEGTVNQHAWWTAVQPFRKRGHPRADWVCVRRRQRTEAPHGTLDTRIMGRLDGLLSVRKHVYKVHEVAMVTVLVVRGSRMPGGEEGMIWVEWREDNRNVIVVQIGQIEGVAHLIALELVKVWLVNNRIN